MDFVLNDLRDEKGAAAVEFALLLPVLTLIIAGVIMFGILFNYYLEITHAAREGVRWAALRESASIIKSKAISAAPGVHLNEDNISITLGEGYSALPPDWPSDDYQGQPVHVTVTYNITDVKSILGWFGGFLPNQIQSEATQRVE